MRMFNLSSSYFFIYSFAVVVLTACDCNNEITNSKDIYEEELEIEVINSTLPILTPREGNIWCCEVMIDGLDEKQQDSLIKSNYSEKRRVIDSIGWILHFHDSLGLHSNSYIELIEEVYRYDLTKFKNSELKSKKIDVNRVDNFDSISVVSYREKLGDMDFRVIGRASYSRILFSKDYTKAEFFYEFGNGVCGEGSKSYFVRVIKVLGFWMITGV